MRIRAIVFVLAGLLVAACGGSASPATSVAAPSVAASASAAESASSSPAGSPASPSAAASESPIAGATPALTGPFTVAGMAAQVDAAAHKSDPSTFANKFPASSDKIYVVFELKTGTTGTVTMDMTSDGTSILAAPLSIDYGTINSWGHFDVSLNGQGSPGIYEATLTYVPTGDKVVIPFALE